MTKKNRLSLPAKNLSGPDQITGTRYSKNIVRGATTLDPKSLDGNNTAYYNYMQNISSNPVLSKDEEINLASRMKSGDSEAREKMIISNLKLVVKIARNYCKDYNQIMDVISEGNVGLIRAVENFEVDKGAKFSTYAGFWIKHTIKKFLSRKTISLPVHITAQLYLYKKTFSELKDEIGRDPLQDELSFAMDIPVSKVNQLASLSYDTTSIDKPIGEDGDSVLGDLIEDTNASNPLDVLDLKNKIENIDTILKKLSSQESDIIIKRFGLKNQDKMTLEEIANKYGITRERIRQIQQLALVKIRNLMSDIELQKNKEDILKEKAKKNRDLILNNVLNDMAVGNYSCAI